MHTHQGPRQGLVTLRLGIAHRSPAQSSRPLHRGGPAEASGQGRGPEAGGWRMEPIYPLRQLWQRGRHKQGALPAAAAPPLCVCVCMCVRAHTHSEAQPICRVMALRQRELSAALEAARPGGEGQAGGGAQAGTAGYQKRKQVPMGWGLGPWGCCRGGRHGWGCKGLGKGQGQMDSPRPVVPTALSFLLPRPRSGQITRNASSAPEITAKQPPAAVRASGLCQAIQPQEAASC